MDQQNEIVDKKGQNNRVKVAIRIRPFIERERVLDDNSCIQVVSDTEIILGNEKLFKFDKVFDEASQQTEVYDTCVKGLVAQCFQGYNSAILAYGQTGSGKTYTMGTTSIRKMSRDERGILPRVIENIFSEVEKNSNKFRFSVRATFLQIYNEHIIDLLSEDHSKNIKDNNMIAIREEKDGSVSIYGAYEEEVHHEDDMLELLDRGSFHRTTSSTLMNEASSRSHAIFTITIQRNSRDFNNQFGIDENYVTSKFVFVDLAGSERLKKTGATGNTLKEGININLGLLELGNVISSLAIEKKQSKFINYRNSKLTRILQDSLGGNSNTYMIACVSPAESNYEESLNSIKYASKAMNIKNKPIINRDPQQAHILKLRGIINDLEKENGELKKALSDKGVDVSKFASTVTQRAQNLTYLTESEQISRLKTRNSILEKKCESLLIENKQETKKSNELQISLYEARRNKDILEIKIEKLLKGEVISEEDMTYTPMIESYLNRIQFLESEIHQKQKSISQLQIEYSKLYDGSQRDSIILTKKNQKIFNLQRKIKQLQRKIRNLQQPQKSSESERLALKFNQDVHIDGPLQSDNESIYEEIDQSCIDQFESIAHLQEDSEYLSEVSNHETEHHKLDTEIKNIQRSIQDRQAFYADINEQQMNLEYKLIEEMKQEYHTKIRQLEKQREKLMIPKRGQTNNNSYRNNEQRAKIIALENEMKDLRKKAKQQKDLEKQVTFQSTKLKTLNDEINSFKMQKIEINRRMKDEKEKFNKFKTKRIKELFEAKKDNAKKEGQIRKLKNENKKHLQQAVKRKEEIKRIKKVNETLKMLMKPKKLVRGSLAIIPQYGGGLTERNTMSTSMINSKRQPFGSRISPQQASQPQLTQDQFDNIISESIKSLLIQIDKEMQKQKILQKCEQIEKEIEDLKVEQSELNIKKQRLEIKQQSKMIVGEEASTYVELEKEQKEKELLEQYTLELNAIEQRLINLQDDLEFKLSRYDDLVLSSENKYFNYETQIIYNKRYQTIESFRSVVISLYRSIIRLLTENLHLKEQNDSYIYQNNELQKEVSELKEQVFNLRVQCQQKIEQAREQYQQMKIQLQLERDCRNNDLGELENYSSIGNEANKIMQPFASNYQKNEDQMRKKYEKKIEELNKNNKALVKQVEVQRKRCETLADKYNSMKVMMGKDRFIGITVKEGENSNGSDIGQNNYFSAQNQQPSSFQSYRERQMSMIKRNPNLEEKEMSSASDQCFPEIKDRQQVLNQTKVKRFQGTFRQRQQQYDNPERQSTQIQDLQFSRNDWELAAEIPNAHKSPILALAAYDNILASTASKSVALWDLQSLKLVNEFNGAPNTTFVKSVVIHPERQIMFTTADRNINVWDLRTSKPEMVLKGHKDEIRLLHVDQDTLFSAGKGTVNGGALLVWDLRGSMSFENIVQKDKNQDIFSMTSQNGILYYGTRDHFVRRMKIQNNEPLLQFQPPHMDTVTGLATLGDYLISGSKDKNLRLWSLQSSMYNLKSTVHSFNDYITCVQSDKYLPLFYASDRSGQIKIGTIIREKIEFVGGILAHSQQINALCNLNASPRRGLFASGSADKSIKLWRPSTQTLEHISNDY